MKLRSLVALALTLGVPTLALAASGGGHGGGEPHINWWTWDMHAPPVGWFLIDFAIFVALLVRFTRKPMRQAFQTRHDDIKKTIVDNTEAHRRAMFKHAAARDRLAAIEREAKDLITRIKEEGAFERDRIVLAARTYAERMQSDTKTIIAYEGTAARERLRAYVAAAALERAEQQIQRALTQGDKERMLDEAIAEIEQSEGPAPTRRARQSGRMTADESGEAA